jgi:ABC-2 type transport system permease protein
VIVAELKAEFRKLVRTRSTYGVIAFALALEGIFAFWANGIKAEPVALAQSGFLQLQLVDAVGALGLIGAIVAVLLVTQEYRYNTIMYTLTAANHRWKVLLAKFLVITGYALVFTIFMAALSPLLARLGIAIQGANMAPQHIYFADIWWRVLFYGWGYAMAGMLIAFLLRNQIGALVALLLLPGLIEQLVGLVLKQNSIYLPFSALDAVIHPGSGSHVLTVTSAALVYLAYLATAGIVAAVLFQKRDAN